MKALFKEPLLQFLVLGAGLFLLHAMVSGGANAPRVDQIVVTPAQIERLAAGWQKAWQRAPTPGELDGLIAEYLREEVYYREALAMGLDRDDLIVRRRLRQKLEFLSEGAEAFVDPTDEELERIRVERAEAFRVPDRYSVEHVFVSRERGREAADRHARELLARIGSDPDLATELLGDRTLLPLRFEGVSVQELEMQLGPDFAEALSGFANGAWEGPVESGYGLHLVRVRERVAGRLPELEEIRPAVERVWRAKRREEEAERLYRRLRARYEIVIQKPAASGGEQAQ